MVEDDVKRRFAILNYSKNPPTVSTWIDQRFAYKIGGSRPGSSDASWMTYVDIYGTGTLHEHLHMKDFAAANGFSYEDMLVHARKNFTSKVSVAFREMDRFDVFEGKNGVLKTKDHKRFEDLSAAAYRGKVKLSDAVYVGYEEPFAEINWEFATMGKNVKWKNEYWNGKEWQVFNIADATDGFSRNGRMMFWPPADWRALSVNGSRSKYFVRFIFSDDDKTPVSSRIFGDNWLNGKSNACRGWDEASPSVVNNGPLAFNPTPPADASAKFRYQSRVPFWSHDHFVANPANMQLKGEKKFRSWAMFVANEIIKKTVGNDYTGVMCDDGERNISADGIKAELTDFSLATRNDWMKESVDKYRDVVEQVKSVKPKLRMGINSQNKSLVNLGDWNLAEYNTFVWKTGSAGDFGSNNTSKVMAYDDYLPSSGKKDVTGLLIYQDTADTVPGVGTVWERANRGPLAALSKHYIGMNKNTIFSYYSRGGFIYDETDEVILKNKKIVHQASEPAPKIEDVHRWATWFPAMGVDIGYPDTKGHNVGKRDTVWKKGKDIGGGPDIWRRDFTQAVVLHRPAFWSTTKQAYDVGSTNISLGTSYYPMRADGITGPGIDRISLRPGEGAILMKQPIPDVQH